MEPTCLETDTRTMKGGAFQAMRDSHTMVDRQSHHSRDKASRRRMRLLAMVVLCFVTWAMVTAVKQAGFAQEKMLQLAVLENKLADTRAINEKLRLEITRLNEPEYIEQKAKKDYQMVRPGETLFTEPDPAE